MCGPSPNEKHHAVWLFDLQEGLVRLSTIMAERELHVTIHAMIAAHFSKKYQVTVTEEDVREIAPHLFIDRKRKGMDGFIYRSEHDFYVRWEHKPFDDPPSATDHEDKWAMIEEEQIRSMTDPDQKNADMIRMGWRGEQYDGNSW